MTMDAASSSKYHHPYFTEAQIDSMSEKQRGKLAVAQEEKIRQTACGLLEAIGTKVGFPRKTIATAQSLYHRFHLFFPRKDFNYFDVSLACLYVSTKMHDTLKKPRELLSVSYAFKYPEMAAKSKNPPGDIDTDSLDPQMVENDRQKLLAIERLVLETICFNFSSRVPFPYVIKLGRSLGVTKNITKLAWRLSADSHRTLVPVQFPPHTIALASLYTAVWLCSFEQPSEPDYAHNSQLVERLRMRGEWEHTYQSRAEDIHTIAHTMMDLLIQGASQASTSTSPRTPSSPASFSSPSSRNTHTAGISAQTNPPHFKTDALIRIKIAMRQYDLPDKPRQIPMQVEEDRNEGSNGKSGHVSSMLGKNEGTVRFLFGPAALVGQGV